ncbi:MAG: CRISPR-associated protein Cas4 [Lachnospiraceae bacterium]|nr:CRISPR-associated protein Cas4 [Lachnospiraceae bacterium]
MEANDISIRSIQHYLYCAHRWGLTEIEQAWAENMFVTKANIMHERVHDEKAAYSSVRGKCYTSVSIYNDEEAYGLYGKTDCLEVGGDGKFVIVEYKPTKPKNQEYNFDDSMQVFAQKICVDYVFDCDCEGALYYGDVKKRYRLPLRENYAEYDMKLREVIKQMRSYIKSGTVPPIPEGQRCSGCSFADICMPKARSLINVRKEIERVMRKEP